MATWVEIPAPADLVLGPDDKHVTNGPVATLKLAGSSTDATHADQNGNGQTTGALIVRPDGTIGTVSARRYVQSGTSLDITVNGNTRRLEPLSASQTIRGGNAANPINTAQVFQSASGADATLATDFHGLFNFPNVTGVSTLENYADSSTASTSIYQLAGAVYNSGTRPAVAVAGFARGKLVWGSNLVVMADGASSFATGLEIDFGIVATGVGTANGLELHAHNAAGNPGHYLGMTARAGLEDPSPRVGIQISVNGGTDQPLQAAGTIFETSGAIVTTYGIDWKSAAFSGATAWLPVNRGSAGSSIGLKLECRGGFANTGSMLQLSAVDGSSTATYAIRVATASGGPVSASGTIIYVDGGTFGKFIDISAATFASSGAIAMGDNNISFGTTTGGKIGTATTQKLGFYNATPIVRPTGWAAATGTPTRTTFATSTVTLPVLAEHVKALIDDLMSLGLIGA